MSQEHQGRPSIVVLGGKRKGRVRKEGENRTLLVKIPFREGKSNGKGKEEKAEQLKKAIKSAIKPFKEVLDNSCFHVCLRMLHHPVNVKPSWKYKLVTARISQ